MGRPAKNTEIEILQTILRLPVELGLNPGQIAVLAILAALGGGTFSRIKQNRGSMDECDEDTAQLQDDHPGGESPDNPGDPLEEVTANLKRRVETVRARQLSRALKREVRDLIRSDAFKERILSEARDRAVQLVVAVIGEAPCPKKMSCACPQSVAPPIAVEAEAGEAEQDGEAEKQAGETTSDAAAEQADNEARLAYEDRDLVPCDKTDEPLQNDEQHPFYVAATKDQTGVDSRKTCHALVKELRKVVTDGDGHQAFIAVNRDTIAAMSIAYQKMIKRDLDGIAKTKGWAL
jgi:hypothetical protein